MNIEYCSCGCSKEQHDDTSCMHKCIPHKRTVSLSGLRVEQGVSMIEASFACGLSVDQIHLIELDPSDATISDLQDYISGIGGTLEIKARMKDGTIVNII